MSKELTKDVFIQRLKNSASTYLYQKEGIDCSNENYVRYVYEYITDESNEIIEKHIAQSGKEKWQLKNIAPITREPTYNYQHKTTQRREQGDSTRGEDWLVLDMYNNKDNSDYVHEKLGKVSETFGAILDYQIPLKDKGADYGAGKIDFIYLKNGELYLAEIKADKPRSIGALKAILEIQTYYQVIDKAKLLDDFNLPSNTKINKVIALFKTTKGGEQVENNAYIKDLLDKFDIDYVLL